MKEMTKYHKIAIYANAWQAVYKNLSITDWIIQSASHYLTVAEKCLSFSEFLLSADYLRCEHMIKGAHSLSLILSL